MDPRLSGPLARRRSSTGAPTHLEGPSTVVAKTGTTKFLHYSVNAIDAFDRRASLTARCTHPAIGDRELAVGPLHNGLVRVSVAVPEDAELGAFRLEFVVDNWLRSTGGVGPRMTWETAVEVVDELPAPSRGGKMQREAAEDTAGHSRVTFRRSSG